MLPVLCINNVGTARDESVKLKCDLFIAGLHSFYFLFFFQSCRNFYLFLVIV